MIGSSSQIEGVPVAPGSADGSYLTAGQAARILGVSPKTVNRWANEGRIPCAVTLGGHRRFRPDVIAAAATIGLHHQPGDSA
jgi:excisionase family DNA binding protein